MEVTYSDFEDAYLYCDTGDYENESYLCLKTGKFYFKSDYDDEAEPLPKDVYENENYIAIPYKADLDIPHPRDFVYKKMPEHINTINEIFSRRGAYRRFKDWLIRIDRIDNWYKYENQATEKALRDWCKENKINLVD